MTEPQADYLQIVTKCVKKEPLTNEERDTLQANGFPADFDRLSPGEIKTWMQARIADERQDVERQMRHIAEMERLFRFIEPTMRKFDCNTKQALLFLALSTDDVTRREANDWLERIKGMRCRIA